MNTKIDSIGTIAATRRSVAARATFGVNLLSRGDRTLNGSNQIFLCRLGSRRAPLLFCRVFGRSTNERRNEGHDSPADTGQQNESPNSHQVCHSRFVTRGRDQNERAKVTALLLLRTVNAVRSARECYSRRDGQYE
jgi:hypothetical protein